MGRRSQRIGTRVEVVFRGSDSRAEGPHCGVATGVQHSPITSLAESNPQIEFEKANPMRVRVLVREKTVW